VPVRHRRAGVTVFFVTFGAVTGPYMIDDEDTVTLRRRLETLRLEHRDLDEVIARLMDTAPYDMLQLRRLKKRKLVLKDEIARLQNQLTPDIIA